jgi:DNA-binding NtrC family response regulator
VRDAVERLRIILGAENDSDIRRLIRNKLPKYLPGYEVIEAQNGMEAVSLAHHHAGPIDIILVAKSALGYVTGTDMPDSLREKYPDVKFIYMFECGEDLEPGENYSLPPDALFLAKPFSMQILSQVVLRLEDRETS